jgi:hypothetical protein
LINIPQLGLAGRVPAPLILIGKVTAIDQHFQMFGDPPRYNPWFVYEARLKNGSKMELFHPQHRLHHEPPTDGIGGFRTHNWRKLHRNLTSDTFAAFRQGLLDFQVSEWNSRHIESEQVVSAKLIAYMKKTGPDAANREIISLIWADWGRGDEAAGSLFDDLEERLNSGTGLPF